MLGNPVSVTDWGTLLGVDKQLFTDRLDRPVFASFQYYQDRVLRRNNHCLCGPFSNEFQWFGFYGGHSGLRGLYYSLSTWFFDKTWLAGDILDTSLAMVHEWQFNDWWIQPQMTWKVTDYTTLVTGFNIFAGPKQSSYGQWTNNSNIYFELHKTLL